MEKNNNDNTFKIKGNVLTDEHIKSKTNADTLFRFLDNIYKKLLKINVFHLDIILKMFLI